MSEIWNGKNCEFMISFNTLYKHYDNIIQLLMGIVSGVKFDSNQNVDAKEKIHGIEINVMIIDWCFKWNGISQKIIE